MRLLVLGGTIFVSYAVAAEAMRRGHEVVCAARGTSGKVPDGAKLVAVDRDLADGLEPLAGERFDAVVDVAKISYPWVARALDMLADNAGHWTFVSSISAYADLGSRENPGVRLFEPKQEHVGEGEEITDPDLYGAIKVASENAVLERLGDRAFVVRPGLVTGPGDRSDRFGYWPARMSRGGRVVVPDTPDLPTQLIDVRDLATWIVDASERRLAGVYDAICPPAPLPEVLAEIADVVGSDVELVPVAPEVLEAAGVDTWAGPKSLPLWLPPSHYGMASIDASKPMAAGLTIRPLRDATLGALEHERFLGLDRPRKAGLTPAEEAEILAS
jgi:nucleoside-diphosphate-sugar epimerase